MWAQRTMPFAPGARGTRGAAEVPGLLLLQVRMQRRPPTCHQHGLHAARLHLRHRYAAGKEGGKEGWWSPGRAAAG